MNNLRHGFRVYFDNAESARLSLKGPYKRQNTWGLIYSTFVAKFANLLHAYLVSSQLTHDQKS